MTSRNNHHPCPIVGMGASAGGFEAFQKFFAHMPPDTGMGFVLVQHLAPTHETLMPELLAKHIRMPVEQVRDETLVERDRIYVIPPNATLTIEGGVIRVQSPVSKDGLRMQIDRFLRSLAEDQGHNAVCILLSGTGSDGMLGLKAIKEQGGMAMAQEPGTSRHDQMPRSAIGTGLVDHVLPVEQMPGVLVDYAKHLQTMQTPMIEHTAPRVEIEDSLRKICDVLHLKTGHDFSRYKTNTLVRRIQRRIQVLQVNSLATYTERLRQDPHEAEQLLKDLLIGVTHFFRDSEAFEALAKEAIPKMLDRAEDGDGVRVWTPGCASGEEAYSVAILLREEMDRRHQRIKAQIFAGDIDEESLEVARGARYPETIAEHVSPERLERFFIKSHNFYQVSKDIREMCIFSTHNLVKDPPFSRLDLISCRNLLIYLGSELQHHVSLLFHYALRPGGFLFLGSSENMPAPTGLFRTIDSKNRIFKRSETLLHPPLDFPFAERSRAARPPAASHWGPRQQMAEQESNTQKLERLLLDTYSPAWVVITSEGEIRYFSPRTGKYLEQPSGAPNMNVISMARQGLRLDLRTALHKAVKTGQAVLHEEITVETNGETQRINLIVRPLTDMGEGIDLYLVVFQELGLPKHPGDQEESRAPDHIAEQLESELRMTKEHLQATIEEVETSNEELKSSNEELLSTNEELQSANEELQTSKEELQSINEELETINSELNKKVEELDHAHGDIKSLFQSTPFAIIYIDRTLRIMHYTPPATKIFSLIESDIGRPLTDIVPRFAEQNLIPSIREVLRTLAMHEREVQLADGSANYILRILPYLRHDNVVDGVILTFADVTELKRSQLQHAQLSAIVESSADPIISRSLDGKIISWNPAAANLFNYSPSEAIGQPMTLIVPRDKIEEMEKVLAALRRGETIPIYETIHIRKGGARIAVMVTTFPLKGPGGNLVGVAANFHDITSLKQAEEALKEEVRQKDDFLAMLSHELRNPLAPLRSCLSVLSSSKSERDQEVAVDIMGRQLRQLEVLVDQLLDTSRLAGNKLVLQIGDVDLVDVVRGVAEDLTATAAAREQQLDVQLPKEPIWIGGDRVRLTQVIANVLHNASKFTEAGGKIVISMRLEPHGRAAVLTVRDTGIGMEPAMVGRLFQHFSQADHSIDRSRGGLGLGLALSKKLLEAHDGTIEGRSDGLNQGSEFTIRIPVDPNRTPPPQPRIPANSTKKKRISRRVLLIDDNPDGLLSTKMMLEVYGHEVETAPDAILGLDIARTYKPEVILCDIGLPGGMDGYEFARQVRKDKGLKGTFLVALTGYGWESDQRQAFKAGFDSHLIKPAHPESLQRLLVSLSEA